jgi:hypothetical protein
MTNYEFACWVRGFLQLCPDVLLDNKKVQILKNHLNLVAAVEGQLGGVNQLIFNEIQNFPNGAKNAGAYADLKKILYNAYFNNAA